MECTRLLSAIIGCAVWFAWVPLLVICSFSEVEELGFKEPDEAEYVASTYGNIVESRRRMYLHNDPECRDREFALSWNLARRS